MSGATLAVFPLTRTLIDLRNGQLLDMLRMQHFLLFKKTTLSGVFQKIHYFFTLAHYLFTLAKTSDVTASLALRASSFKFPPRQSNRKRQAHHDQDCLIPTTSIRRVPFPRSCQRLNVVR